ncbi:MAG: GNAT family N-acetyltransferase [Candidatus Competibacterales bacterium]|nr:GNAT family N-acetyltransferase [Candidatus Competibacterales bacterium]
MDQSSLAAERIERAALVDLHDAAPNDVRRALGMSLEPIGHALVSSARHDPNILLNRCLGLGVEGSDEQATVQRIAAHYAEAGVQRYFVQRLPEARPAALRDWLRAAGLIQYRGWVKFLRRPLPPPALNSELQVREIGPQHARAFGRIVAPCFDLTDAAIGLLAALVGRPGWHIFMSFAGSEPAGTGALFVKDGVGWCDWGATHPDYRGRGGQGALLCRRIQHAIERGCRLLVTTTGEAVPGDPQHSYRNIELVGFEPAYVKENYVPQQR